MIRTTTVVVPGEGEIVEAIGNSVGDDVMVATECPKCGNTETPGWLPGFVIPV